jgi:shikimate kinase/3-dehydroquinate synthase
MGEGMLENPNIVLTGFMAAGKTSVGEELSRLTGFDFVDADSILEERLGLSVPDIFRAHGEKRFREEERKLASELSGKRNTVMATGGGMILDPESRKDLDSSGEIFCLRANVETILKRAGTSSIRPLLEGADQEQKIKNLLESRKEVYQSIKNQIDTDDLSPTGVAVEVLGKLTPSVRQLTVETSDESSYPVIFGRNVVEELPGLLSAAGLGREVFVVTDSNVHALHSSSLICILEDGGYDPRVFSFPAGETSKTMETVTSIFSFLADRSAQRDSTVIAFGGGVVGDAAGFAASTYMRGIQLIHIPTTLLAQGDSSIGGKNAVNTEHAKNLIGTFHHPRMVITDPDYLKTLPEREFRSGFAEVLKTEIIESEDAFSALEVMIDHFLKREIPFLEPVIFRCIRQKAAIVSRDPYENDERRILNLGHTFGHAIEHGHGYTGISHGEAVALGIRTAAVISVRLGKLPGVDAGRIVDLLEKTGLLRTNSTEKDRDLLKAMVLDKKARKGKLSIVLPEKIGEVTVMEDLEPLVLGDLLEELNE